METRGSRQMGISNSTAERHGRSFQVVVEGRWMKSPQGGKRNKGLVGMGRGQGYLGIEFQNLPFE